MSEQQSQQAAASVQSAMIASDAAAQMGGGGGAEGGGPWNLLDNILLAKGAGGAFGALGLEGMVSGTSLESMFGSLNTLPNMNTEYLDRFIENSFELAGEEGMESAGSGEGEGMEGAPMGGEEGGGGEGGGEDGRPQPNNMMADNEPNMVPGAQEPMFPNQKQPSAEDRQSFGSATGKGGLEAEGAGDAAFKEASKPRNTPQGPTAARNAFMDFSF